MVKRKWLFVIAIALVALFIVVLYSQSKNDVFADVDSYLVGADYPDNEVDQIDYYVANAKNEIDEFEKYNEFLEAAIDSGNMKEIELAFLDLEENFEYPKKPVSDSHFHNSYINLMKVENLLGTAFNDLEETEQVLYQQDVNVIQSNTEEAAALVSKAKDSLIKEYKSYKK